jgi:ribonuclease HI
MSTIVTSPSGVTIRYQVRIEFPEKTYSTNNKAKYKALLLALRKMKALSQQMFIIKSDSKVIQEHVKKESEARNSELIKYLQKVREMEKYFKGYTIQQIPRSENNEADKLTKAVAQKQQCHQMCSLKSSKPLQQKSRSPTM